MSVYTEMVVDDLEKRSHSSWCRWRSGLCTCKRPDYVIEDSKGRPIIGLSRKGYRVRIDEDA